MISFSAAVAACAKGGLWNEALVRFSLWDISLVSAFDGGHGFVACPYPLN